MQRFYQGYPGATLDSDLLSKLPPIDPDKATDPEKYVASEGLVDAVNIALHLGLPLLLTGEPGIGKSSLAYSLNRELGLKKDDVLHFTVKSDTSDNELFYNYDTLGRFHAVHGQININDETAKQKALEEADPRRFIRYQALGKAILLAKGKDKIPKSIMTSADREKWPTLPRRSVVLIDEIDKAPRDMPNDILNEIERMQFSIPELFYQDPIRLEKDEMQYRPIVIITSNGERELPEAFLRRCLYFHLEMPPFDFAFDFKNIDNVQDRRVSVQRIVYERLGDQFAQLSPVLQDALKLFRYLREEQLDGINRRPSLAELLDWLRYLAKHPSNQDFLQRSDLMISLKTNLLKNRYDQERVRGWFDTYQKLSATK